MTKEKFICRISQEDLIRIINCIAITNGCHNTDNGNDYIADFELEKIIQGIDFDAFIRKYCKEIINDAKQYEQVCEVGISPSNEKSSTLINYRFKSEYSGIQRETVNEYVKHTREVDYFVIEPLNQKSFYVYYSRYAEDYLKLLAEWGNATISHVRYVIATKSHSKEAQLIGYITTIEDYQESQIPALKFKPIKYLTVNGILEWLENHNQAYTDFLEHYQITDVDITQVSDCGEKILEFIGEHKQLEEDFMTFFFGIDLDKFYEYFTFEDLDKIFQNIEL